VALIGWNDSQAAIVKGAALRGLEGLKPSITIATRHYGWSIAIRFREGIDDEKNSHFDNFDSSKRCLGRMEWVIDMARPPIPFEKSKKLTNLRQHQELKDSSIVSYPVGYTVTANHVGSSRSVINLYECTLNNPPERVEHPRVVKIAELVTVFDDIPTEKAKSNWNSSLNSIVYQFEGSFEMRFRAEEGTLQFKSTAFGEERGNTTVKFNRDR
jgi:hypothetical protein